MKVLIHKLLMLMLPMDINEGRPDFTHGGNRHKLSVDSANTFTRTGNISPENNHALFDVDAEFGSLRMARMTGIVQKE